MENTKFKKILKLLLDIIIKGIILVFIIVVVLILFLLVSGYYGSKADRGAHISERTKADLGQLGIIAQSIYNNTSSYVNLCDGNMLNKDSSTGGTELNILLNDIKIYNIGGTEPICYASHSDFCVSLALKNGSKLCVGTKGLGKNECLSANTECKP